MKGIKRERKRMTFNGGNKGKEGERGRRDKEKEREGERDYVNSCVSSSL